MHLKPADRSPSTIHRLVRLAASGVLGLATVTTAWALRAHVSVPISQSSAAEPALQIASGEMAQNVLTQVQPVYPAEAREAHLEGSVILAARISAKGAIDQLTVVSGPDELAASALEAVRQWTYRPYLLNGEPVPVQTTIHVNYRLAE